MGVNWKTWLRFWTKITVPEGDACWTWDAAVSHGYGVFHIRTDESGKRIESRPHRTAYEILRGEIKAETLDHLCRNKICVNPDHLDPCSAVENMMRGDCLGAINARKTHCPSGHLYSHDNIRRKPSAPRERNCRECHRIEGRRRNVLAKEARHRRK